MKHKFQSFADGGHIPALDVNNPNNMFKVITVLALNSRNMAEMALRPDTTEADRKKILEHLREQSTQIAELTLVLDYMVRIHSDALQVKASTDVLTGLKNRAYFEPALDTAMRASALTGEPLALLAFDIDHFKRINDDTVNGGHDVGDNVLKVFARQLQAGIKDTDLVARVGGEEFFVLLPGVTHKQAVAIANRLRLSVAKREGRTGLPAITTSVGVAMFSEYDTAETFKKRADKALYWAKNKPNGRNCVVSEHAIRQDNTATIVPVRQLKP